MKPSDYFMNELGKVQRQAILSEVNGEVQIARLCNMLAPAFLIYAAFFRSFGL